jgi:NADPH-dependent 2,4-dienoyl-CoA reductase/sulfur reductase-like enzyme/peroxiredoxin family protein/rhodanese-related sulfurtransferase/TusA-related sulfurtransferase
MAAKKVLIVGGVAGGASAAARLRRLDEHASIIMFERGEHISFANCGLPYFIGNSIKERSRLLVQTPEGMKERFNIDVRTRSEVISINHEQRLVKVRSADKGLYEETYDALILSPGARPVVPDLPGISGRHIYTLRNIPDMDSIKSKVDQEGTRSAIVIGGGFIGVEMAENLREAGLEVTLIEAGPQVLAPMDPEMAGMLAGELSEQGIGLLFNERVQGFEEIGEGVGIHLESGSTVTADLVLLAIGVTPDTTFLRDSGLELGPRGHIVVNDKLESNLSGVFAVGDAVEVVDYVNGGKTAIPLAGPANKQGRIAADNVCGLDTSYKGTQGTSIIKVFGLTGAATGSNEKTLKRLGLPYHAIHIHPNSHAGYYPGASSLALKLLFDPKGVVLGAQAVGRDGVDKRIDDIATLIRYRGNVMDLSELELAYAPPYSSAKDPVNMAGYVAENVVKGLVEVYSTAELERRDEKNTVLLDVRSQMEHAAGHIPGSMHIPVDELRDRLEELDASKEIWVYCQVGLRGYTASRIMKQRGFRVKNLSGGYKTYRLSRPSPYPTKPRSLKKAWSDDVQGTATGSGPQNHEHAQMMAMKNMQAASTAAANTYNEASVALEQPSVPSQGDGGALKADATLDACGLCCPGPLLQVKNRMEQLHSGQVLQVTATDPGFYEDIRAWAKMTGNDLMQLQKEANGEINAWLQKADGLPRFAGAAVDSSAQLAPAGSNASTIVVFSGDLDKAIASFIIANGAAASGKKVTLFFTFWGLSIIRKTSKSAPGKSLIGKMFGTMLPRGSRKLKMSRMNMAGAGPAMIRSLMKSNNVASLEELIQSAIEQGVEIVACQMSMDLMGLKREELVDEAVIGGVGYYLGQTEGGGHHLFI